MFDPKLTVKVVVAFLFYKWMFAGQVARYTGGCLTTMIYSTVEICMVGLGYVVSIKMCLICTLCKIKASLSTEH